MSKRFRGFTVTGQLWKGEGSGNDFFLGFGSWATRLSHDTHVIRGLCDRRRGLGADGALALFPASENRVRLIYHNADGSRAHFCANGTRVAALAAHRLLGLSTSIELETDWALISAVTDGEQVTLQLPSPETVARSMRLSTKKGVIEGPFLILGVPHFFIEVSEDTLNRREGLPARAPALRDHPAFGDEGSNISLIARTKAGALRIRTFEQGVEQEVLSCGSAMASAGWFYGQEVGEIDLLPASGDRIHVSIGAGETSLRLQGPARLVARIEDFSLL